MSEPFASPGNTRYPPFAPLSLPKEKRVVRSAEFRSTYQNGTRISSRFFVAFCGRTAECDTPSRFGFTCPRALGKAVDRNRIKRRMREALRRHVGRLPQGFDLILHPRRVVLTIEFARLEAEIVRILDQAMAECQRLSAAPAPEQAP